MIDNNDPIITVIIGNNGIVLIRNNDPDVIAIAEVIRGNNRSNNR